MRVVTGELSKSGAGRAATTSQNITQGVVFEIEGGNDTVIHLQGEGVSVTKSLGEAARACSVVPLLDESKEVTLSTFGLRDEDLRTPECYYKFARKIKLHKAVRQSGYEVNHTFRNLRLSKGDNYFYARISQLNGQYAWSSPVWIYSR